MASAAQVRANRSNAKKSTGPRTAEGKEKASRNAVKHGLLAREAVIQGEDPEEFERYREWMLEELGPVGPMETMLAERVVGLSWRLRRAERLQNAAFATLDDGTPMPLLNARLDEWKRLKGSKADRDVCGEIEEEFTLGRVVVEDFARARVLDRLLLYERRIESSLYRTMAQLRRERQAREAARPPEEVPRSECRVQAGQESVTPTELASFGANVARSTATREITLGSPESRDDDARGMRVPAAALSGEALAVAGKHGRNAHATGTPDGVTRSATDGVAMKTPCGVPASAPAVGLAHHSSIPSFQRSNAVPGAPAQERRREIKREGGRRLKG